MSTTHWQLWYLLPNSQLEEAFEFPGFAFAPCTDARAAAIYANNAAARLMVENTRTIDGLQVKPGVLLFDPAAGVIAPLAAAVDARNCLAISCALQGWQASVGRMNSFLVRETDYFDFYRRWPSLDGQSFCYSGAALELIQQVPRNLTVQPHPYILPCGSQLNRPKPDEQLFPELVKIWTKVHVHGDERPAYRRLMRSLSVAYEAARVPEAMGNPFYDHGKHCAFWVSAFETLAHPGGRNRVNLGEVLNLLERFKLIDRRLASRRSFKIARNKRRALNRVQRLYQLLYNARNAFLHGNRLEEHIFIPKDLAEGVRLIDVAPLVYQTAVVAALAGKNTKHRPLKNPARRLRALIEETLNGSDLEDGFCRALGLA